MIPLKRFYETEIKVFRVPAVEALKMNNNRISCVENFLAFLQASRKGSFSCLLSPGSINRTIGPMTCILINSEEAAGRRSWLSLHVVKMYSEKTDEKNGG